MSSVHGAIIPDAHTSPQWTFLAVFADPDHLRDGLDTLLPTVGRRTVRET